MTRSLVTVGFLFLHVGICADPLPLVVRFLWVPVALLPLLALLVGMMGTRLRIVAWGLLFLGLLMVAASLFPAALLTTRSVQPLGVAGLFGAPRTGAYAYLLAGMLCVVLGARKHDRALGEGSSSWRELVGLLGCVAAVFLVSTVALFAMPRSDGAVFTAGRSPGTEERVTVTCVNHMRRPIVLFVPWPERRSLLAETAPSAVRYGIRVYARAESTSEFQLLPAIGGVWRHKGRALPENAAVTVEPGLAADLELDVGPIQQLVGRIVGLRVHVTDNGGRIIHEFETPIAARAALQALPRGAPPVVRPGLRPVTRAVEGERAPREERPSPTQPERPAFIVRLRGIVGDRAALEVVRGQGAGSQNVMAAVGDEVAPGWSVEAVSMRPVAVTFLEQRTGERIKAERGIEVRLVLGGE